MPRARVAQTDGLHRTEPDGVRTALRHDFDGHAALVNIFSLFKRVQLRAFRRAQRLVKRFVFRPVHRTVEIVLVAAAIVPRRAERVLHIDALRRNDRRRSVKKAEKTAAKTADALAQRLGRKRSRRDDHGSVRRDRRDLLAHDGDVRVGFDARGDRFGEQIPVHRERSARRHAAGQRRFDADGAEHPHLLLQKSGRRCEPFRLERIGTDQFREFVRFVRRGKPHRLHFRQCYRQACRGQLRRSFHTGKPAADHQAITHRSYLPYLPSFCARLSFQSRSSRPGRQVRRPFS